jgi:hypothetical protein
MKGNAKDYVSTAQQFFTAYDAHDVDGMLGLCADGALGRMPHTAAKASCRSVVASMLFGARFRMPFRTFESK